MIRTLELALTTDEHGAIKARTKRLNGYLLMVVLPKKRLWGTEVRIYPETYPELMIKIPKKDESCFRVKMDSYDFNGMISSSVEDLPLDGSLIVEVKNAVPEMDFPMRIIYEGDLIDSKSGHKEQSKEQVG